MLEEDFHAAAENLMKYFETSLESELIDRYRSEFDEGAGK